MSRRKTVKLNLPVVDKLIKEHCRSNVVFCEKMGRPNHKTWVTDWHREKDGKPAPKGFPSPAEAVQMCALLNTTPEEILTEPDDIALVRELIEQERAKQGIKKDLPQGEAVELTDLQKKAWAFILSLNDENLKKFIAVGEAMIGE